MTDPGYVHVIEIWQDGQLGWHWHAKSANGEILFTGESHPTYSNAERAALKAAGSSTPDPVRVRLIPAP